MPEHFTQEHVEPFEPPFDPETSVLTYGDVLEHPDTPETLHPHLQRLAAGESSGPWRLAGDLSSDAEAEQSPHYDEKIDAVIDALNHYTESDKFDVGRSSRILEGLSGRNMVETYRTADYPVDQAADLLRAAVKLEEKLDEDRAAQQDLVSWSSDYDFLRAAVISMPGDVLRGLYFSEEMSVDIKKVLKAPGADADISEPLKILQKIYGCDDMIGLVEPNSAAQQDTLVQAKVNKLAAKKAMASELMDPASWTEKGNVDQITVAKRDYADRYLGTVLGLPEALRDDMLFASHARTSHSESGYVNAFALEGLLIDFAEKVDALGVDKIKNLHEKARIVNLDFISLDQLKLMSGLVEGDPEVIEHLKEGDVTVAFFDKTEDWTGETFIDLKSDFATESNRTLLFDVGSEDDFDAQDQLLEANGIEASTTVLAFHGAPGGFLVSGFYNSNYFPESMANTTFTRKIARFVNNRMRDSRGIDDNPKAAGRRRLVMQSCHQEVPQEVWYTPPVQPSKDGSRIDKPQMLKKQETSAETLLKATGNRSVDMFAGDAALSLERTERGIRMHEHYDPEQPYARRPVAATQLRLDDHGNVIRRRVDEIILRRDSSNVTDGRRV